MSVSTGDKTGRLMLYDPSTKNVTVLLHGLAFANGVALSKDGDFVLVTQTTAKNILSAGRGKAVKLDAQGNFLDVVDGLNPVSHVEQHHGNLWIGYVVNNFVGVILNFV
ncbi:hypothetical protein ACLB2K_073639 [Fragaria x ananassa]